MSLRFRYLVLTITLVVLAVSIPLVSQKSKQNKTQTGATATSASSPLIERGRYLVNNAGMCIDCHTPRNEKGEPIVGQDLMGAPILFKPSVPIPWAEQAPRIAGLPGWSDEAAVKFLMTGEDITGKQPRPPMPPYRFNRKDAEAITAYLKSIESQPATAEGK